MTSSRSESGVEFQLEQLDEAPGCPGGAVGLHVAVVDAAADLLRDPHRGQLRWRLVLGETMPVRTQNLHTAGVAVGSES